MHFGSFMASTVLKRLTKIFDRKSSQPDSQGNLVISGHDHSLSKKQLCKHALNVVQTLQRNNYQAYVVGGCVRDLLLGLNPKDFDVATDAKPQEVKKLFRRSRIVGRRFQIVHVQFGREIIEVTTFRSNTNVKNTHLQQAASGLLTRDNMFGTMEEDASRRDLTINALYYDPTKNTLHDFSGGLEDLKDRTIRIIGDPSTRYKEDPVRLLRVARFAAKLDFHVENKTLKPIAKMAEGLNHVSAPRMFDETLKLFMGGQGLAVFNLLTEFNILQQLLPQTHRLIEQGYPYANKLLAQAMTNTDLRISSKKRVTPAFIYAALLWPPVHKYSLEYQQQGHSANVALNKAANDVIGHQISITAIPKRFTTAMREIWSLQLMLPKRAGNRAKRLSEHPRFRAAYDFVLLREQSGEDLNGLGDWWTTYQDASEDQQQEMVNLLTKQQSRRRRSGRRPRGKS